jgi:hypothetical protein
MRITVPPGTRVAEIDLIPDGDTVGRLMKIVIDLGFVAKVVRLQSGFAILVETCDEGFALTVIPKVLDLLAAVGDTTPESVLKSYQVREEQTRAAA